MMCKSMTKFFFKGSFYTSAKKVKIIFFKIILLKKNLHYHIKRKGHSKYLNTEIKMIYNE